MKKTILTVTLLCMMPALCFPKNAIIMTTDMTRQKNLAKWQVTKGDFSGITHIGADRYAMISDKDPWGSFYLLDIFIDSIKGKIKNISLISRPATTVPDHQQSKGFSADVEDVAYVPAYQTLFIADEGRQKIVEYQFDGQPTGRQLKVPSYLSTDSIYPNYGFESLTYDARDNLLWTVTEHTLRNDGPRSDANNKQGCLLRLQSFSVETCEPVAWHYYRTDAPTAKKRGRNYAFGVSAITAMEDGTMLLMEREFHVSKNYLGSWVKIKIYKVDLQRKDEDGCLHKEPVVAFKSRLNAFKKNIANYEGMCLGPKLADGSQTVILVSDSQNNYGNRLYHLKDYIRIIIIHNSSTAD